MLQGTALHRDKKQDDDNEGAVFGRNMKIDWMRCDVVVPANVLTPSNV